MTTQNVYNRSRILLLGYSSIARRRVIPAMLQSSHTSLVGIASKHNYQHIKEKVEAYRSYRTAIDKSGCDTVYISLHNSAHYQWIRYALSKGKNIICDKPAVLTKIEAQNCCRIASNKLLIFESLPYLHHQQHHTLLQLLSKQHSPLQVIIASFGVPAPPQGNYRSSHDLGGGCIYDLGPYLISIGQHYFKSSPTTILTYPIYKKRRVGIPDALAVTIGYRNHNVVHGYIGFGLEYINKLELWGETFHFSLDRAFTSPPDAPVSIQYKNQDTIKTLTIQPCDAFSKMLKEYWFIQHSGKYQKTNKSFLERATTLDALVQSAHMNTSRRKNKQILDVS